jgi:hypothetical protein
MSPRPDFVSPVEASDILGVSVMEVRDLVSSGLIARDARYVRRFKVSLFGLYRYARANHLSIQSPWPQLYPVLAVGFPAAFIEQLDDAVGSEQLRLFDASVVNFREVFEEHAPLAVVVDTSVRGLSLQEARMVAAQLDFWQAEPARTVRTVGEVISDMYSRWPGSNGD